ncbi:MAG: hypothetical protein GWN18_10240 [Thermoplasmata archaeon]|nr:hypothetical protein [Thermoplasmata archaeon]NIS12422.1 hypothetical protein [Thermoplasmata archaeon]NIS20344.1 hypothetical protein [Thermoplasmata archaeon]NIT76771.1 hypothetical protein [Thermoplasmata archaeon]NIU49433.1 hypothetical protein [Thermoplasmata archaeon]
MVTVKDPSGNQVEEGEWTVHPVNIPPSIEELPLWNLIEEEEGEMDLSMFLHDDNDAVDSLTLTCTSSNVTIDGLVMRGIFARAGDIVILITVSDGDDSVPAEVQVHVENVNDVPILEGLQPMNGTRVSQYRTLRLVATVSDEDGDDLTVTWMRGSKVLGTGNELILKDLDPGEMTLRVVVSDGKAEAEGSLTIVVEEEDGGSLVWWVLGAVLVGVALLVTIMVRSRRSSGPPKG